MYLKIQGSTLVLIMQIVANRLHSSVTVYEIFECFFIMVTTSKSTQFKIRKITNSVVYP